ncbi:hypothetical protein U1Q18_051354 [Sarracenia purpurea var. burkii]
MSSKGGSDAVGRRIGSGNRSLVIPGYRYLGPGNVLDSGQPVNDVDSAARDHDYAYDEACSEGDIRYADSKFISDISQSTDVIGKTIGAIGINVKAAAEKALNVSLYPSSTQIQRNAARRRSVIGALSRKRKIVQR